MRLIELPILFILTGCSSGWLGLAEDVFDNAITVEIQEKAIKPKADVKISVDIIQSK